MKAPFDFQGGGVWYSRHLNSLKYSQTSPSRYLTVFDKVS